MSRTLVSYKYAEGRNLPRLGEIIAIRFSQDLFGPGSEIATCRNLPSGATQYNYHHAIVVRIAVDYTISLTILPMPAYSSTDSVLRLSSTSWLLAQPDDFQRLHIPVPYEEDPTQPHLPFPVPAGFPGSLEIGGWKNSRPSWVQAVPQVVELEETTTFKCYEPHVILSKNEFWRIREYCRLRSPPFVSTGPDVSLVPSPSLAHQPDGNGDGGPSAGTSLALQTLYANEAVKHPLANLPRFSKPLDPESDYSVSDSDSDDNWEDNMDPITFARYYADINPHFAKIVQEHDQKMREHLNQRIATWVQGVRPVRTA